jgi:hypothetical protein
MVSKGLMGATHACSLPLKGPERERVEVGVYLLRRFAVETPTRFASQIDLPLLGEVKGAALFRRRWRVIREKNAADDDLRITPCTDSS